MLIRLPEEVAQLYVIVKRLEEQYPGRPFTLDGHLVGSLGEVIAERVFGLSLYPPSHPVHCTPTPFLARVPIAQWHPLLKARGLMQ
jgi:hypothetical protein